MCASAIWMWSAGYYGPGGGCSAPALPFSDSPRIHLAQRRQRGGQRRIMRKSRIRFGGYRRSGPIGKPCIAAFIQPLNFGGRRSVHRYLTRQSGFESRDKLVKARSGQIEWRRGYTRRDGQRRRLHNRLERGQRLIDDNRLFNRCMLDHRFDGWLFAFVRFRFGPMPECLPFPVIQRRRCQIEPAHCRACNKNRGAAFRLRIVRLELRVDNRGAKFGDSAKAGSVRRPAHCGHRIIDNGRAHVRLRLE